MSFESPSVGRELEAMSLCETVSSGSAIRFTDGADFEPLVLCTDGDVVSFEGLGIICCGRDFEAICFGVALACICGSDFEKLAGRKCNDLTGAG